MNRTEVNRLIATEYGESEGRALTHTVCVATHSIVVNELRVDVHGAQNEEEATAYLQSDVWHADAAYRLHQAGFPGVVAWNEPRKYEQYQIRREYPVLDEIEEPVLDDAGEPLVELYIEDYDNDEECGRWPLKNAPNFETMSVRYDDPCGRVFYVYVTLEDVWSSEWWRYQQALWTVHQLSAQAYSNRLSLDEIEAYEGISVGKKKKERIDDEHTKDGTSDVSRVPTDDRVGLRSREGLQHRGRNPRHLLRERGRLHDASRSVEGVRQDREDAS